MLAGGKRAVERHTVVNKKLLVRDRLKKIMDKDSPFLELSKTAGLGMDYGNFPGAGIVTGIGWVNGVACMMLANDATMTGGTYFPITVTKYIRAQEISESLHIPAIFLVDSGGVFLPLQAQCFPDKKQGGTIFYRQAIASSKGIPQIAIVGGSCHAGGAYIPTMADEAIIVDRIGTLFLGGPPLVKAATGEIVSEEELGGASMHCRVSGCMDYFSGNEEEALSSCRDIVASLNIPSEEISKDISVQLPLFPSSDLTALSGVEERDRSTTLEIIARIVDGSRFHEFKPLFGANLVTGFAFLDGQLIGILGHHGALTSADALKGCHFLFLCDLRGIPVIFLHNSPLDRQTSADSHPEDLGIALKDKAKMAATVSNMQVPKIAVTVGACLEDDCYTMCGPGFQPWLNFAWPLACLSMKQDTEDFKRWKSEMKDFNVEAGNLDFDFPVGSAFHASCNTLIDGVILPEHTRKVLSLSLSVIRQGQETIKRKQVTTSAVLRIVETVTSKTTHVQAGHPTLTPDRKTHLDELIRNDRRLTPDK
ncbi:unnamed protein product [Darwinula stevensoni]|uniref:methylcrotonoyl-CoA carboxylase n=1 Tax=Darwinula stevensoni TaxID=69355 RepID=A0A7R9AEK6_9CRUS|nr:unnamed protein product [Darwinula stevensoni]CAG0902477.1 unnamed protein product [Darwinula stevensoni]